MRSGMASPKIGWIKMFKFTQATVLLAAVDYKMTQRKKSMSVQQIPEEFAI